MPLADAVQGATRPAQLITWYRDDDTPEDLTGATLTGLVRRDNVVEAITGDLTVTDGTGGVFRWDYSTEDVAIAGRHEVQFNAAFASGQTPAKTFVASWTVRASLSV